MENLAEAKDEMREEFEALKRAILVAARKCKTLEELLEALAEILKES